MNKFIKLHDLYKNSGIKGPVITLDELRELQIFLKDLADYMGYRNDTTMAGAFWTEYESVRSVVIHREMRDTVQKWAEQF